MGIEQIYEEIRDRVGAQAAVSAPRTTAAPGIDVLPLRTPTLPPATHTGCYLAGDAREVIAIDPASPWPDEQDRLTAALTTTPTSLEALCAIAYADTPPMLSPIATRSLLAHLIKLAEDGRARAVQDRWQRT